MFWRSTYAHLSLGMPDNPRPARASLLHDQKVILSVDEKLLMMGMFCRECCIVGWGSGISLTIFCEECSLSTVDLYWEMRGPTVSA